MALNTKYGKTTITELAYIPKFSPQKHKCLDIIVVYFA